MAHGWCSEPPKRPPWSLLLGPIFPTGKMMIPWSLWLDSSRTPPDTCPPARSVRCHSVPRQAAQAAREPAEQPVPRTAPGARSPWCAACASRSLALLLRGGACYPGIPELWKMPVARSTALQERRRRRRRRAHFHQFSGLKSPLELSGWFCYLCPLSSSCRTHHPNLLRPKISFAWGP